MQLVSATHYIANVLRPYDTDNNTFRVDENLGASDRFYVTGILGEQKFHNTSIMPLTGEIKYQKNSLLAVNWEHTLSPNMFNQFRVGYNWMNWRNGSDSANGINYGQPATPIGLPRRKSAIELPAPAVA